VDFEDNFPPACFQTPLHNHNPIQFEMSESLYVDPNDIKFSYINSMFVYNLCSFLILPLYLNN